MNVKDSPPVMTSQSRSNATHSDLLLHRARKRTALFGAVALCASFLVGGAGLTELSLDLGYLLQVTAVALFVIAMVTLAVGMVGNVQRRK